MNTSGRLLARNSALNLIGQLLPIGIAIASIPALIRGLGSERFGILALGWAVVGYFGVFELGLSRALTQSVARRFGLDLRHEIGTVAWTAILLLFALGTAGGAALALATPWLMKSVLTVPELFRREGIVAFWVLAASLPFVLATVGLRGLMEAEQNFGAATALRIPLSALTYLGPLIVLPFSTNLVAVALALSFVRLSGFVAHLAYCVRSYPYLRQGRAKRGEHVRELLAFGSWLTVTNVVSPMMVYLDRFVIATILPMAAVAHYVTPYEAVSKLMLIPTAILGPMLPAFAAAATDARRRARMYDWSMRGVILAAFPFAIVGVFLGPELLRVWTGSLLPSESGVVLQWLALGVFINGLAQPPFTMLQAMGRPDLVARLHLIELPMYALALWWLVSSYGLVGIAVAWTLRVSVDALALLLIARQRLSLPARPSRGAWLLPSTVIVLGAGMQVATTSSRVAFAIALLVAFGPIGWMTLLDREERTRLRQWVGRLRTTGVSL